MATTTGSRPINIAPAPSTGQHAGNSPKNTAGHVLISYFAQQLAELRRQAPLVRQDQPDSVHQMRTSARRLRSALATGKKLIDDGAAADIRSELKWLSEVLGAARDPEVIHERLNALLAQEPKALIFGPAVQRIDEELTSAAAAGRRAALEALDGDRYPRLLVSLEQLVVSAPLTEKASGPARKIMRKLMAKEKRRLRRKVAALEEQPGDPRDVALHDIRKAAKRVRYAAEAASPVAGKKAGRTEQAAHRLQKILGLHQDSVVARALLEDLGERALRSGENAFTYGRLHAIEEGRAGKSESDFAKAWKKFS
jgi:CHAD domain-containing protein